MGKLALRLALWFIAWAVLISTFWWIAPSQGVDTARTIIGIGLLRPAVFAFMAFIYWLLPRGPVRERLFLRSTLTNKPLKHRSPLPSTSLWDHFGAHGGKIGCEASSESGIVRPR